MPFGRWAWHSLLSPNGGASLLGVMICTPAGGAFKVKVCSHLRWGRIFRKHRLHAYPAGADFCSCASSRATLHVGSPRLRMGQPSNAPPLLLSPPGLATRRGPQSKTRLGLCPKTPVAGCAGYGLIFDGSPKSIRTAHRIAPKVAAAHLPFPPTPFPEAGKGPGWAGNNKPRAIFSGC